MIFSGQKVSIETGPIDCVFGCDFFNLSGVISIFR